MSFNRRFQSQDNFKEKMKKIMEDKVLFSMIISIALLFFLFYFRFPNYTYDSYWYIDYLDYFIGERQLLEWNPVRGFVLPFIIYLGHLIKPGYWGLEIVLSVVYCVFCLYVFAIYRLVKKYYLSKPNVFEIIVLDIVILLSPIVWGYAHTLLTEGIANAIFVSYIYSLLKFKFTNKSDKLLFKNIAFFAIKASIFLVICWYL